ncbi:GNAT family N-acetyltransferase [Ornithinibacillus halophilus]|uniref:Bifunctional AAC/APH n=1 Tax=Ornithinibacillus halophilus TaxID=930117 RepID=A0A1M5HR62_9BACI|nr:GNAT family N-acetyltransferase [Ornithinibacillus halophilus]SHG18454.1 Protein N-acetyltransferase, RimJ/RimL family [Ornithinibacillus halophilus]
MRIWSGAAGICVSEHGKLLMVKQGTTEEDKLWAVPSGGKQSDETFEACCIREVKEETGYDVEIVQPLFIKKNTTDTYHFEVQYFEVKVIGGEKRIDDPDHLIYDVDWKDLNQLKDDELGYPGDRKLINDVIKNDVHSKEIVTARCYLSKVVREDYKHVKELYNNEETMKYLGGIREEEEIRTTFHELIEPEKKLWVIRTLDNDEFVGLISLDTHHNGTDVEVSYQLLPRWWKKGIGSEVVKEIVMYAFTHLKLLNIVAETQVANEASRKLLEKQGFVVKEKLQRFGEEQVIYCLENPFITEESNENGREILKAFGFELDVEPESIYPFSPVYKINDVIIKRTQDNPKALIDYLLMLKEHNIQVVTPVKLPVENPQRIDDETYIAYPFIKGDKYEGTRKEIYEAGKLLGEIHALSPKENSFGLSEYDVYDFNEDEVEASVHHIHEYASKVNFPVDTLSLREKLLSVVLVQEELKDSGLPHIATPHDYKANNLIYRPDPYLIDPDNASWIPRIFDLALALLLFHNEMDSAPDRVFTTDEWEEFLRGYKESVFLTDLERDSWQKAIEHVFLDEVMWLMAEFEEDWESPSQRNLFKNLLEVLRDSSGYRI